MKGTVALPFSCLIWQAAKQCLGWLKHKRAAMNKSLSLMLLLLGAPLIPGAALAQAASPAVYSSTQRDQDETTSRHMVETVLKTSYTDNEQYVRWKQAICPHVSGLAPAAALVIERRVRAVATQVGAPVDPSTACVPNISIIATTDPQASLLSIAKTSPYLVLGGDQQSTVRYPVQAWYATWKTNYKGVKTIDIPDRISGTTQTYTPSNLSRLGTGRKPEMATVTVLADTKVLIGMTLGELADYMALLTLTQTAQYGACQPVETIANLMVPACPAANKPHKLSHADIALLTALYEVADEQEQLQKSRIIGGMRRSLEKQFGKD